MMMQERVPLYTEVQQFRQPWIWAGLIIAALSIVPLWYGVYRQLVDGEPLGDNPASDNELLIMAIGVTFIVLGLVVLFLKARLETMVDAEGIRYRFFPFHLRTHEILWETVAKATVRTYRPILEYGGWGIRYGLRGKAYNVSGNQGLELELRGGGRILFGTQRPVELDSVVRGIMRG
jgi:hypothetical protein